VVPLNLPGLDLSLAKTPPLQSTAQSCIDRRWKAPIGHTIVKGVSAGVAGSAHREGCFDRCRCELPVVARRRCSLHMASGQYKEERGRVRRFFVVVPLKPPSLDPSLSQVSPLLNTAQCCSSGEAWMQLSSKNEGGPVQRRAGACAMGSSSWCRSTLHALTLLFLKHRRCPILQGTAEVGKGGRH
jgi:hypothetical protein